MSRQTCIDRTKFDTRITIERATITQDDLGEDTFTWGLYFQPWAAVANVNFDEETLSSGQKFAEAELSFTIPKSKDVNAKDRISWRGKLYEIVGVQQWPPARTIETKIFAKIRTDQD